MREVQATLSDVYKVHKTFTEFLSDCGRKEPEDLYRSWTSKLTSHDHKYVLLMHGKKIIGMIWGRNDRLEVHPTFIIEGVFLRRAYRKFKFKRELNSIIRSIIKDFHTVLMVRPSKIGTLKKRNVLGSLVCLRGGI